MPSEHVPAIGSRVGVPWGLDTVEGEVISTYPSPAGARAVVNVTVPGTVSTETVAVKVSDLRPLPAATEPPGAWYGEYLFAEAVREALVRAARRLPVQAEVRTEARVADQQIDGLIQSDAGMVVIEVKRRAPDASVADQLQSHVARLQQDDPRRRVAGLFVVQDEPSVDAVRRFRQLGLAVAKWDSKRDDPTLTEALAEALSVK